MSMSNRERARAEAVGWISGSCASLIAWGACVGIMHQEPTFGLVLGSLAWGIGKLVWNR